MNKLKVMTILGTRPEIIRLSRVMAALDQHTNHIVVHTGQNYDLELSEIFFQDLNVRRPDYFLGIDTSSLGKVLGGILIEIEPILRREKPDAVLILGDTNSAIAAIMAKRLKIPVYHMEAGNRCFDLNVPEEINRRLVDHISDFNLVYTEHARRHLLSEGLPHRRIYLTGSPLREVLLHYTKQIESSEALTTLGLEKEKYFVVSMHREENVDNKENLQSIVSIFNSLVERYGYPIIFSIHPRTRKRLDELEGIEMSPLVKDLKPFGFFDYNKLQKNSYCTLSDSGTIGEESAILEFPAITLRKAIERPEALDVGSLIVTGFDKEVIHSAIDATRAGLNEYNRREVPPDYEVLNCSQRVVNLIIGTCRLSNDWDGVCKLDE